MTLPPVRLGSSASRSDRFPVNLIDSPITFSNRLIGSPFSSEGTGRKRQRSSSGGVCLAGAAPHLLLAQIPYYTAQHAWLTATPTDAPGFRV